MKTEYIIDATGKSLGRVATQAASVLLGKNTATAKKNAVAEVTVRIIHAKELHISEKKQTQKKYHHHSGYPGSDRSLSLKHIANKKGYSDILVRAVKGMLPLNKLRAKRLKNLIIEE